MACGDLVPWPGIEPRPPALRAQSLSHWPTKAVPATGFLSVLHWVVGALALGTWPCSSFSFYPLHCPVPQEVLPASTWTPAVL